MLRFLAISGQPRPLKWQKMANFGCFSSLDTQKTNFLTGYNLTTPLKFMLRCVEVISNPILMKKAIFGLEMAQNVYFGCFSPLDTQ